ncbi:MAG: hypothetical protein A2X94_17125 [Bdellovibrionales bacterium GWB1_55_8]|nr:MAG: hypothetical protein A2X94_17125 [Bdellovibrionales bacterium GWB1_55_8]
MTQLTRIFAVFVAGLLMFSVPAFCASAIENARDALSRAQNDFYQKLRKSRESGPESVKATREATVAPAAHDLGKSVHQQHEAVVKKNLRINQNSKLPEVPDTREYDEDAPDAEQDSGSSGDRKVVSAILEEGSDDAVGKTDDRKTAEKKDGKPPKAARSDAPVVGAQRRPARPPLRTTETSGGEDTDKNALKEAPKAGEGVNVIEF